MADGENTQSPVRARHALTTTALYLSVTIYEKLGSPALFYLSCHDKSIDCILDSSCSVYLRTKRDIWYQI